MNTSTEQNTKETQNNGETRVTRLLSVAADWEPNREAPEGLAHTALKGARQSTKRIAPFWASTWQWSGAIVAAATMVVVVTGRMGNIPEFETVAPSPVPSAVVATAIQPKQPELGEPKGTQPMGAPKAPASGGAGKGKPAVSPRIPSVSPRRELPALIRPRRMEYVVQTNKTRSVAPRLQTRQAGNAHRALWVGGEKVATRSNTASRTRNAANSGRVPVVKSPTSSVPSNAVPLEEELVVVPVLYTETDEETNTVRVTPAAIALPAELLAQSGPTIPAGMPPGTVSTE